MKKKWLWIAAVIVLVPVCLAVLVGLFIGPIIKTGVETFGPKIIRVPVTVASVDVSLAGGNAGVSGLVVGNPQGYASSDALRLGQASVSMDLLSVFSKKIHVRSVRVESLEVSYDGSLAGDSNLATIMSHVNASAAGAGKTVSAPDNEVKSDKPAPKIQLDDLLIKGVKVNVNLRGISARTMTLTLPDIHLTDLGKDTEGITPEELVREILSRVTGSTLEAVTGSLKDIGKTLKGLGQDLGKEAGGSLKTIQQGISGLFGK